MCEPYEMVWENKAVDNLPHLLHILKFCLSLMCWMPSHLKTRQTQTHHHTFISRNTWILHRFIDGDGDDDDEVVCLCVCDCNSMKYFSPTTTSAFQQIRTHYFTLLFACIYILLYFRPVRQFFHKHACIEINTIKYWKRLTIGKCDRQNTHTILQIKTE